MWLLTFFILVGIVPWRATALQPRNESDILTLYPTCAQNCLQVHLLEDSCLDSNNDWACLCARQANHTCSSSFSHCLSQSCSIRQTLTTQNITMINCHLPTRDRSSYLLHENLALLIATLLLTTLRTLYKIFIPVPHQSPSHHDGSWFSRPPSQYLSISQRLHVDDYALISITALGLPNLLLAILALYPLGVGRDAWALPVENIAKAVRYGYVMGIIYFLQVAVTKVVFLLFYLRIFPGREVRRVLWATISVCVLFGLGSAVAGVLQCSPVKWWFEGWDYREGIPGGDATWEGWGEEKGGHGRRPGKCINRKDFRVAAAVISIAIDIWMLAIPLWCIRGLRMGMWKKMGVAGMFGIGMLVTIFSCIRLRYLTVFTETPNPTQALFDIDRWSTLEAASSIFCACMPTLRQMVVSVVSLGRKRFGKRRPSSGADGKVESSGSSTVALGINSQYSRSIEAPVDSLNRHSDTSQQKLPDTEQPNHGLSEDITANHGVRSGNSSIMYTVEYSVEVDNTAASLIIPHSGRLSPPPYTYGNGLQDLPGVNDGCENYRACVVSRNLGRMGGGGGGSLRRQGRSPKLMVAA
ncbi:hypothetical protein QBC32DRAFT_269708 [Pseudoneurospora amorphoporcata]|uniref:Extracellular membrane protein CFEM domain-containing protein n=1 Tax=Pseudoneurospora amorphoporcata TaxID=241081 RepID=A0AAN6NLW9_9PEZI|nr:hypothetical protein QBC32DRAFT_269708 [Pseudoneurospora amorphoporcata]